MCWSKAGPLFPARPEHPLPEECWPQTIVVSAIPGSKLRPAYIDFGLPTLTSGGRVPDLRRPPGTESISREQSRGEEPCLGLMLKKSNFQPSCIDLSNSAEIKGRQPGRCLYFSEFWKPLLVSCFSKVGYGEKRRCAARALAALARGCGSEGFVSPQHGWLPVEESNKDYKDFSSQLIITDSFLKRD